jgi:hypothetical protein
MHETREADVARTLLSVGMALRATKGDESLGNSKRILSQERNAKWGSHSWLPPAFSRRAA